MPSVRASLPSRIESFNVGRAGAQPYRVTTASAECGKVRQIVIRSRFLGMHAFCSSLTAHFSPDGQLIATASDDGSTRIWDTATGKPLSEPLMHDGQVNAAQFSPDGKRVVTSSADRTARVWDFAPQPSKTHVWLPELVEVICRGTLTESGSFKGAEKTPADMVNQIRQELSTDPVQDDWVEWTRWFLADPAERTISPFSQITVSNYNEI